MRDEKGFTLIEVMIVVVVIGILASIAYPAYTDYVLRSHRGAAQSCLTEMAQFLERNRSAAMRYDQDGGGTAIDNASIQLPCAGELAQRYTFSFAAGPAARTFSLQAVPQGAQTADDCGTLTLNQAGAQGAATTNCW